jgi:hypothetical protein
MPRHLHAIANASKKASCSQQPRQWLEVEQAAWQGEVGELAFFFMPVLMISQTWSQQADLYIMYTPRRCYTLSKACDMCGSPDATSTNRSTHTTAVVVLVNATTSIIKILTGDADKFNLLMGKCLMAIVPFDPPPALHYRPRATCTVIHAVQVVVNVVNAHMLALRSSSSAMQSAQPAISWAVVMMNRGSLSQGCSAYRL